MEKVCQEEAHTRRLSMIEHDMLRKKVTSSSRASSNLNLHGLLQAFAFEDQLAQELRREELERERRECDQVPHISYCAAIDHT